MNRATVEAQCCIVGAGPAGMMLAVLLARAGVDVLVLEKSATLAAEPPAEAMPPSTRGILAELGWLSPVSAKTAFVPQCDFLTFLVDHGRAYPSFRLRMSTEVVDVLDEGDRIKGVVARGQMGAHAGAAHEFEVRADLVIAADGHASLVRDRAGMVLEPSTSRLAEWWRAGLLCIGEAAHATAPGDLGIELAIQDAVAAANVLAPALRCGVPSNRDLAKVQSRRELPTRAAQVVAGVLHDTSPPGSPAGRYASVARHLLERLPWLQRLPEYVAAVRPEHVASPEEAPLAEEMEISRSAAE